jgi:Ca-activated chloride channel family protein
MRLSDPLSNREADMTLRRTLPWFASLCAIACLAGSPPATQPAPSTAPAREIRLDMDQAQAVALPEIKGDLAPTAFKTPDGKDGWVVRIPGNRPIATPAYAEIEGKPMLFVGGGYGSHEFYAFDAVSGEKVWQIQTADDGPTAAVVEDGYVSFNTESCTVIVADAKTGKVVWQEWLGDPLMSQPAISRGKLYMVYPAGQAKQGGAGNQAPNAANAEAVPAVPAQQPPKTSHRLLCADLKTGKHLWEQDVTGDAISAPIVEGEQVFLTCFDGTSFCLGAADGAVVWKKQNAGTSAPLVAGGQVVITQRAMRGDAPFEGLRRLDPSAGEARDLNALAEGKADYLKPGAAGNGGLATTQAAQLDAAVGFAAAPAAANLSLPGSASGGAVGNVNVNSVAQAWAFQGSKAAYANGAILNAQGNALNCVDASTGGLRWRGLATGKAVGDNAQIFAPPALGANGERLYLCSVLGHVLSVAQSDGRLGFAYAFNQPMNFQPALAKGNVYAPTNNGLLICLRTGTADADGWTAWGGNAQHNKTGGKGKP